MSTLEACTCIDLTQALPPEQFAEDVRAGLIAPQKYLPVKYLYNHTGSPLFEEITQNPHYYLTRAEEEILRTYASDILTELPVDTALVELGSGSAAKTRQLIEALLNRQSRPLFVPIDISRDFLFTQVQQLSADYPALRVLGIAADYHAGLEILAEKVPQSRLILWLGSDIGHTGYATAAEHLKQELVPLLNPEDRILLGIDLKKPVDKLHAAYGCTRQPCIHTASQDFALNLLQRINYELDGDFDIPAFQYQCHYDEEAGCINIYLVSMREQTVTVKALGLTVGFGDGDHIHIHSSYKYDDADIQCLAEKAGLRLQRQWFDAEHLFSVNLLAPVAAGE